MQINLKIILDVNKALKINQKKKNLIIKRIQIINKLFDNYQSFRKEIGTLKSKNLVNNQIYEEEKRRIVENKKLYEDKINDINNMIKKKLILIKKTQKKFMQIQIYIRSESQNYYKYKKQFMNFTINSFILENECLIKYKKNLYENIEESKKIMKILNNENMELNKIIFNNNNYNENSYNNKSILKNGSEKLKCYLLIKEEEIKYYKLLISNIKERKIIYEAKIVIPRNIFLKEINNIKNNLILNTEFSQEISNNNNEPSIVRQTNNDILESNISNTIYDFLNKENSVKSNYMESYDSNISQEEDYSYI